MVWRIYAKPSRLVSIILPLLLSLSLVILATVQSVDSLKYIDRVSNIIIQVIPSILGFILTGYVLFMGLSSSEYIEKLKAAKGNRGFSFFQELNATFAFVLFTLFVSLLVGIIASLLIKSEAVYIRPISLESAETINKAFLFGILFLLFYSTLAIKDIVMNIFSFGQLVQIVTPESENESNDSDNTDDVVEAK